MNRKIDNIILIGLVCLSLVGLYLMLNLVSPSDIGPFGVLAVFATIYIFTLSIVIIIIRLLSVIYQSVVLQGDKSAIKLNKDRFSQKRVNLIASVISLGPIFFVSLNSIGQLGFTDVALVVIIEFLLIFYVLRKT